MKVMQSNSKTEKYKLIAAIALGVIAVGSIVFLFFGDSFFGSSTASNKNGNTAKSSPTPSRNNSTVQTQNEEAETLAAIIEPIVYNPSTPPAVNGGRNIFDIYIPPPPTPTPIVMVTPTPPPPPPLTLTGIQPANVYARTPTDFTVQVFGDKFTPETRISFDNNDLPTKFISPQQLTAVVPASLIYTDGGRQIMARTPDGRLYSNYGTMNVMVPPMPNYLYVGLIGDKRFKDDIAILRDKSNDKDVFSIKLGQVVKEKTENRFKVISISERELILIDKTLNIKHIVPYMTDSKAVGGNAGGNYPPGFQPNPRVVPQGEIPGIPSNIPRYQPPQPKKDDDDDDDPN